MAPISISDQLELDAQRADLKSERLQLQADQAEFRYMQQLWEKATKGGGGSSSLLSSDRRQLEVATAKLEEERLQLEAEKTQMRLAQIKLKAAQSKLEDAKSKLEAAQTELEEARNLLETARSDLEAAMALTDIKNMRLEAVKTSLEAAKMRFESATNQLKDAKSNFEAARTQMEAAAAKCGSGTSSSALLEEENAKLQIQVGQLLSENKSFKVENNRLGERVSRLERFELENFQLKNDKSILEKEVEDAKSKLEVVTKENKSLQIENKRLGERLPTLERLESENSQLKNDKSRLETEVEDGKSKLEDVTKENKSLQVENKRLGETVPRPISSGNPKVFMAFEINGRDVGRIVFELFADTTPRAVENFRAYCTGEMGVSPITGKPLHYKGMSIYMLFHGHYIRGGGDCGEYINGGNRIPIENFIKKHTGRGDLSLATISTHPGTTEGLFVISDNKNSVLDGVDVVIGRIVEGMHVLDTILASSSVVYLPSGSILIADCGQLS